ncbi:formate dehydrogenase accessory protein FdhE [Kingella negevensis]|uniref:formate dehydrogenase accessory protein FdhE n=1 Tax=Kingella negevensis TaxID=1522312 RepID=UPI002543C1D5|nr:formate dehydrogenase accessory protein FdhE [Kingella negevensis]MDK4680257.1 formate dehydrogenase accessory protein FdhE [Kingella negevensis]MDK4682023.1 formate dehydrogenase accessory protein FdhE [Kingella negevensis]MDK4684671.1 formate dehydrogenase accessory protein FdhE [Kingella negevensis]MDK4690219.1 formate dehydrogenase accessory protein FdhE [Kingella negevensis]MDK4692436.1 formate dehydrogenase accessory protein FdhE [Kingella negevensis]
MDIQTPKQIKNKPFFYKPFFIPPKNNIFVDRAIRFDELAAEEKTSWREYLALLAELSRAQNTALNAVLPETTQPENVGATKLPESNGDTIPPLFFKCLQIITRKLQGKVNDTVQAALNTLVEQKQADVEGIAKRVLREEVPDSEQVYRIWVHAALQCAWTAWASQLTDDDVPSVEERSVCPCCGGEAVASVVLNGGDWHGLRYLHCAVCNSRWNALRAKCTFCGDQSAIEFHQIEGADSGVLHGARGESCGKCGHYRKLLLLENQQYADPIADDLASLAVDILLGSENIQRGGHNPFLLAE